MHGTQPMADYKQNENVAFDGMAFGVYILRLVVDCFMFLSSSYATE